MQLTRRTARIVPSFEPEVDCEVVEPSTHDEDLLRVVVTLPAEWGCVGCGLERVSRVYSPVAGSTLSVSSSAIPSSPVTGVHRPWFAEVNGFQYGVVDFAIPYSFVSSIAATQSVP